MPGEEEQFAHPDGGDRCTSIGLSPALWRTLAGETPRLNGSSLYVDGRIDLAHRRFLAADPGFADQGALVPDRGASIRATHRASYADCSRESTKG